MHVSGRRDFSLDLTLNGDGKGNSSDTATHRASPHWSTRSTATAREGSAACRPVASACAAVSLLLPR